MRKRGKQRWRTAFGVALLLALSLLAAQGQRRRDPLNPLEIDQLRDAMLDPEYHNAPATAERRIAQLLHPAVVHQRKGHAAATRRVAAHAGSARSGHSSPTGRRSKLHQRTKRGV